jgi:hypothetical protein
MSTNSSGNQRTCDDFIGCLSQFVGAGSTWEVERNKQKTGSDVVVKIRPRSEEAAPIDARLELDFGVYLLLGVAAQFEIPFSKTYYTGRDWLTELDVLCRAVASWHFEERVIYAGEKAVYSKHQLVLENGKTIRESWGIRPILPWRKTRIVEHHYAAHSSRPAAADNSSTNTRDRSQTRWFPGFGILTSLFTEPNEEQIPTLRRPKDW